MVVLGYWGIYVSSGSWLDPELIEPIKVVVEQIDKTATPFSTGVSGRRETQNFVKRIEQTFNAQVVFGNDDQKQHSTQLGVDEEAAGYCIFLESELEDLGKRPVRGDRIVKFIGQNGKEKIPSTKLYFNHSGGDLGGHFSNGGFGFVRLFFMDRDPVG